MSQTMGWVYLLILMVAAFLIGQACKNAWGVGLYPPIPVIAAQLNLATGQQLPKGVIWNGRPYFFYIKSAQQLANGEYVVRLKAQ